MHISRQSFINERLKTLPRRDEYAPNRRSRSKFRGFEVRAQFNEKQTLNLVSPPEIDWHNLAEPHVPEVMELSIFFFLCSSTSYIRARSDISCILRAVKHAPPVCVS